MATPQETPGRGKQDAHFLLRLPAALVAAIEAQAERWGVSRNEATLRLIELSLMTLVAADSAEPGEVTALPIDERPARRAVVIVTDLDEAGFLMDVLRQSREG